MSGRRLGSVVEGEKGRSVKVGSEGQVFMTMESVEAQAAREHIKNLIRITLAGWDLSLSTDLENSLDCYANLILEWNERINLTAVTNIDEIWIKHFLDSLSCFSVYAPEQCRMLDIGSGAGLPGLVLALARPEWDVHLLESINKKAEFLRFAAQELKAGNVSVITDRAETAAHDGRLRESFDMVVARGVAPLRVLAEYCLPFLHVGGLFLAMKGPGYSQEMEEAGTALRKLGGAVVDTHSFTLPEDMGSRVLITIAKQRPTPDLYPRRPGIPAKKPL
ncbi:MAG: 16S rRNA (guanine(527)-N(7))-methyltransferase RsmG [Bacillota bacterium]